MPHNLTKALRLVLVTDDRLLAGRDPVALAVAAVAGGVTAVQLRLKHAGPRALVALTRRLRQAVHVPVLVNDRVDVAAAAGAGVHLGPDDLAPALARGILPRNFIIGASVGSADEAARGMAADYWGIGPWRITGTKPDVGAPLGPAAFATVALLAGERPRLAIGGVRPEDVADIMAAGGTGVAVISGILSADDVQAAARRYSAAFPAGT